MTEIISAAMIAAAIYFGLKAVKLSAHTTVRTHGQGQVVHVNRAKTVQPAGLVLEGNGAIVSSNVFSSPPVDINSIDKK